MERGNSINIMKLGIQTGQVFKCAVDRSDGILKPILRKTNVFHGLKRQRGAYYDVCFS